MRNRQGRFPRNEDGNIRGTITNAQMRKMDRIQRQLLGETVLPPSVERLRKMWVRKPRKDVIDPSVVTFVAMQNALVVKTETSEGTAESPTIKTTIIEPHWTFRCCAYGTVASGSFTEAQRELIASGFEGEVFRERCVTCQREFNMTISRT